MLALSRLTRRLQDVPSSLVIGTPFGGAMAFQIARNYNPGAGLEAYLQELGLASDTAAAGPALVLSRCRGTFPALQAAVQTNDILGALWWTGRDTTTFATCVRIEAAAQENFGAAAHGARLNIWTTLVGNANPRLQWTFTSEGHLTTGADANNGDIGFLASNRPRTLHLQTSVTVAGLQVLNARKTGWGAPTGTATRTTFATGTVTLAQLAERVKALIDDLTLHGMIGA